MKTLRWLIVLLLMAAAVIGARWSLPKLRHARETRAQAPVTTTVQCGDITVTAQSMASLRPEIRIEIRSPLNGRVEEALVSDGDRVTRGQVLARVVSLEHAAWLDAAREKDEAEVKKLREFYHSSPILAPSDGTILQRMAEPGQFTGPDRPMFILSNRLVVEALADETDLAHIQTGSTARIVFDAYPETTCTGEVFKIAGESRVVDQITVYAVLIRLAPPPAFARSGLSATATFEIARRTGVLLLPVEAVQLREGQAFVEVPSRNPAVETPERIPVGTGISDGRSIEIVAGLNEGDRVLLPILQTKAGHGSPFVPRMSSRPPAPSTP